MSHTPPGGEEQTIWGVLAIAAALRRLSQYPLLVLTNGTQFADGTTYAEAFRKLRVQRLPLYPIELTSQQIASLGTPRFQYAFWKVQLWNMTQFDKLIWLDADSIPTRSVDWLFERDGLWMQADDPWCTGVPTGPCAAVMLVQPNVDDFRGMLDFTRKNVTAMRMAEQYMIPQYFEQVKGRPVRMLRREDVHIGFCLKVAPSPFRNKEGQAFPGLWNLPSIVHKSGGGPMNTMCIDPKLAPQLHTVGNATINICSFNPLGIYWRDMFCKAAHQVVGLRIAVEVLSYCNDACWYGYGVEAGDLQEWGPGVVCAPNATTDPSTAAMFRELELSIVAKQAIVGS